jgi:ribosomal-protein-alanine N-acetyltransferase
MAPHPAAQFEIAAMTPVDVDAVMEIERLSYRSPWPRQVFVEELSREWAHIDVLRDLRQSGRVVGFCNYWLVQDEVHLLNVAIHPAARRRGLASRLLNALLGLARQRSVRFVTLEVRRSNLGAIGLYRRFGFRPAAIRASYYTDDREDAVVMLLAL